MRRSRWERRRERTVLFQIASFPPFRRRTHPFLFPWLLPPPTSPSFPRVLSARNFDWEGGKTKLFPPSLPFSLTGRGGGGGPLLFLRLLFVLRSPTPPRRRRRRRPSSAFTSQFYTPLLLTPSSLFSLLQWHCKKEKWQWGASSSSFLFFSHSFPSFFPHQTPTEEECEGEIVNSVPNLFGTDRPTGRRPQECRRE